MTMEEQYLRLRVQQWRPSPWRDLPLLPPTPRACTGATYATMLRVIRRRSAEYASAGYARLGFVPNAPPTLRNAEGRLLYEITERSKQVSAFKRTRRKEGK